MGVYTWWKLLYTVPEIERDEAAFWDDLGWPDRYRTPPGLRHSTRGIFRDVPMSQLKLVPTVKGKQHGNRPKV